jgi:hypothetical protein
MSEAQNNLAFIKSLGNNISETKLKNLEARIIGPSSNGNLPVKIEPPLMELDTDMIKSSKFEN